MAMHIVEMTADLPSVGVQRRWMAEPLRAVIFPTSIFLTNRKGFPVLSKVRHQTYCNDPGQKLRVHQ